MALKAESAHAEQKPPREAEPGSVTESGVDLVLIPSLALPSYPTQYSLNVCLSQILAAKRILSDIS